MKEDFQILSGAACCRRFARKITAASNTLLHAGGVLVAFARGVYQNNYMIRSMVVRDLKARYIGSSLGFFWSIIHPLTQIIIYYFIFSVVLKIRLGPQYGGTDFAVWLIAGLLPWFLVAEVLNRSPGAVLEQSAIISKTVFPSELLPLTQLLSAITNHLIGLLIFMGFLMLSGYEPSLRMLLILPIMFITGLFTLGIAWTLAALNVFLRDIGQFVGVVVNIWFYLNPIIYPLDRIPESLQKFYLLNPMVHIIEAYRLALLGRSNLTFENIPYLLVPALAAFVIGGLVFKKLKPSFACAL